MYDDNRKNNSRFIVEPTTEAVNRKTRIKLSLLFLDMTRL